MMPRTQESVDAVPLRPFAALETRRVDDLDQRSRICHPGSSPDSALASPAVGEGTDVRFETEHISGSALLHDDRVVHVEVHRVI